MPDQEHADDAGDSETDLDLDAGETLTEQAGERVSPLILSAAVIGVLVGLFVWGSLVMSVMSSTEGLLDDLSTDSGGSPGIIEAGAPTPGADAVSSTPDASRNRGDCEAIRGTDYRSAEERQWFLANCVTN